jgi:hypothetical protein
METVRALFAANLFGIMQVTQAILPHFRENGGGRIVNVSSGSYRGSDERDVCETITGRAGYRGGRRESPRGCRVRQLGQSALHRWSWIRRKVPICGGRRRRRRGPGSRFRSLSLRSGRIVRDWNDLIKAQHLDDRFEVTELLFATVG